MGSFQEDFGGDAIMSDKIKQIIKLLEQIADTQRNLPLYLTTEERELLREAIGILCWVGAR